MLGPDHHGSVVPLCSASNSQRPSTRGQNYTGALQDLRMVLEKIGEDPTGYSEHSMRRGGASEAAARGATPEAIRDFGNWTSVRTALKYVHDRRNTVRIFSKNFMQDS